ncbi:hypothetical protein PR048_020722 [Dryococelus australis]|uniref:Uncharacterized protein n=1 Tax=Dryococelus australis TaxID=614101 RepID=A0ABQ9H700_9NEOP|nr:hypothetical protein PR048_020722 [Dryococelus australis]
MERLASMGWGWGKVIQHGKTGYYGVGMGEVRQHGKTGFYGVVMGEGKATWKDWLLWGGDGGRKNADDVTDCARIRRTVKYNNGGRKSRVAPICFTANHSQDLDVVAFTLVLIAFTRQSRGHATPCPHSRTIYIVLHAVKIPTPHFLTLRYKLRHSLACGPTVVAQSVPDTMARRQLAPHLLGWGCVMGTRRPCQCLDLTPDARVSNGQGNAYVNYGLAAEGGGGGLIHGTVAEGSELAVLARTVPRSWYSPCGSKARGGNTAGTRTGTLTAGRAVVAERVACSPHTKANRVQSPAGSHPDFRMLESRRTTPLVGGFPQGSPVPPPLFHSSVAPYSPQLPSSARC